MNVYVYSEQNEIRKVWHAELEEDGFETSTISRRFKLKAADGKMRFTDCFNTEHLFQII